MEKSVSTILFDLGGVILNLDYNRTIEAFKTMGENNFEKMYSQAQQNNTFDYFETGKISPNEFRSYLKEFLGSETTDQEINDAWNAMLLDLPKERLDFLEELKKKYRILLFSNTNAIHLKKFREIIFEEHGDFDLLEKTFHKTYYSHEIGLRKPHGEAFEYILKEQNLSPEEVVFIDDSIQHVEGAKSIGINAYLLKDTDIITLCKDLL